MKELFICEKCGAQFTSYEEAYDCEHSHNTLNIGGDFNPEIISRQTYLNGGILPSKTIIPSDERTEWNQEEGKWEYHTFFGVYRLVKVLSDAEAAEIMKEKQERKNREQREYEEWLERYNAEKAAKEAEEQSA